MSVHDETWDKARPANGHRKSEISDLKSAERLPPHAPEAEAGLLGCILHNVAECLPKVRKKITDDGEAFYLLANRQIWCALIRIADEQQAESRPLAIDDIILCQWLKDHGHLEGIGGPAYFSELHARCVPENLDRYLGILLEKFAYRRLIARSTEIVGKAYDNQSTPETLIHWAQDEFAKLAKLNSTADEAQRMYITVAEAGDDLWQRWFGRTAGIPGLPLPAKAFGDFPFLIRPRELTLLDAETGMGKSTITRYIILHLLALHDTEAGNKVFPDGIRAVVDSREEHYIETFKSFQTALLGTGYLELCAVGHQQRKHDPAGCTCQCVRCKEAQRKVSASAAWLHSRLRTNETTGIKHWRDILDAFHELAEQGFRLFVLDNVMRIGIPDDDFTQQSACVAAFAQFCMSTGSHMFLINHRTKASEGGYRQKSGGTHKIPANAHNVVNIWANEKKAQKLAEISPRFKTHPGYTVKDFVNDVEAEFGEKLMLEPDATFYLNKQRLSGSRQNASRKLWFLSRCGHYYDWNQNRPDVATDWLHEWTKSKVEA